MTIADINTETRLLCDADTSSYTAADLLRRVNAAFEQVVGWLINADGTAQFDDSNYTTFPIGTYTMVADQAAYSFNDKFLQLLSVKVKNSAGDWVLLTPIDEAELGGAVIEEMYSSSGMPEYYDKLSDDTIKLYPSPATASVTLTSGLKLYFKRTASVFTSDEVTTGTKEPGFASPYHSILSYMAAIPYCMAYKKDRLGLYEKKVMDLKKELIELYSQREKDKRKKMTVNSTLFR